MNKFIRIFGFALILIAILTMSSCRMMNYTVLSTKSVDLKVEKDAPKVKAWGWTIEDAIDNAIDKGENGSDALIDGAIYAKFFGYSVKGTPVKTSKTKE